MGNLNVKRAYLPAEETDGYRILIDRLWPRGISKETMSIDEWAKTIAPTPELRKWFGHKEENFSEFRKRYEAELAANTESDVFMAHCEELLSKGNVTLIYGTRSATCNHALVLRDWIIRQMNEA